MVDTVYGGIIVFSAAMILYFKYIRSRLSKCFMDRAFIQCLPVFCLPWVDSAGGELTRNVWKGVVCVGRERGMGMGGSVQKILMGGWARSHYCPSTVGDVSLSLFVFFSLPLPLL
jgi:hypothetical protein